MFEKSRLDPNDAYAHGILAFALNNCQEIDAALDHVELALSISPSCVIAHQARGLILNFSGHPAEGRESLLLAMQHDPRGMKLPIICVAHLPIFQPTLRDQGGSQPRWVNSAEWRRRARR